MNYLLPAIFVSIIVLTSVLCIIFVDNKNADYQKIQIKTHSSTKGEAVIVAHLSDMHFPNIDANTDGILYKLEAQKTDIIAITGDLIGRKADVFSCGVLDFIAKLVKIAPVYYVNGNHEFDNSSGEKLYEQLYILGVNVLQNKCSQISIKGKSINIFGLFEGSEFDNVFDKDFDDKNSYNILLVHRPERCEQYSNKSINLILSGHAHGGQVRIFGKGLIAPSQGLFPKYSSGLYDVANAKMVVSRGVGNSFFPFRFNNKPHIPIIELV